MTDSLSKTPDLFLSNAAARDYGFTDEFWHKVYTLYLEAVQRDPSVSYDKLEVERTIRMPFQQESIDVLVRCQPRPYEFWVMRFTAFPGGDGDKPQEIPRWYWYDGPREVLGEAALLDASNRW